MLAERDDDEEAEVAQDLLKSLGLPKENCLAHHPLEDIKRRRRKIKTKKEAEMKESDLQARRRKVKIRKKNGKEKSESDKDVKQVTRDYDEEEQGYDSEKEKKEEKKPAEPGSPKKECSVEKGTGDSLRESKVNGDDHHEEDMDMSD